VRAQLGPLNFSVFRFDGFGTDLNSRLGRHYRLHLANGFRTPDVNSRSIKSILHVRRIELNHLHAGAAVLDNLVDTVACIPPG
jgi:hypothetical protein